MGPEGTSHTIISSLEGEAKQWAEVVSEEIMSENFPKPVKNKTKQNPLLKKKKSLNKTQAG